MNLSNILYVILILGISSSLVEQVFGTPYESKIDNFKIDAPTWTMTNQEPFTIEKTESFQIMMIEKEQKSMNIIDLENSVKKKLENTCISNSISVNTCEKSEKEFKEIERLTNNEYTSYTREGIFYHMGSTNIDYIVRLKAVSYDDSTWYFKTIWTNPIYYSENSYKEMEKIESSFSQIFSEQPISPNIDQTSIKNNPITENNQDIESDSKQSVNDQVTENDQDDFMIIISILSLIGSITVYFLIFKRKKRVPSKILEFQIKFDNSKLEISHVELEWLPPNDNFSKIIQYHIQHKAHNMDQWKEETSNIPNIKIDLKKGSKYQFRIASSNNIGISEFSPIKEKFFTSTLLDQYQQTAVSFSKEGSLMVTAGPGSGKTRVVAERVKELILNQNVPQEKILCMTFSRAGMKSMKKRLEDDQDFKNNGIVFESKQIRTIHSFCLQYLSLGPNPIFQLKKTNDNDNTEEYTDEGETWKKFFESNPDKFGFSNLSNDEDSFEQLINAVSAFKKENRNISDLEKYCVENFQKKSEDKYIEKLKDLSSYWIKYQEHLSDLRKNDFDDLLQETVKKFNYEEFTKQFGEIEHLIIDEFQDNNYLQFEIIKKISPHGKITVVGDKNQSIYSFQGANIELYRDFADFYRSYERIPLKYNYRSTPQIVEAGNNFLEAMLDEQEGVVKYSTFNPNSTPVHVRGFSSINLEIAYIFNLIVSNINKKIKRNDGKTKIVNFSDFAILTRTNEARLSLRKMLITAGIPCKSKGFTTLEYKEEKITRFLRHVLDTNSLNINNTISELVKKIKERSDELEDDQQNKEFTNLQMDFENNDNDKMFGPESNEKHMVQILLSLSAEYLDYAGDRKILEFLDYIKNPNSEDKIKNRDWHSINNAVEIKTVHSVKGEEFSFVIIANSVEHHYPINFIEREIKVPNELKQYQPSSHDEYVDENAHFDEESRIYYVAMTRAKNELFLTYSLKDRNSEELESSRFLKFLEFTGSQQNLESKIFQEKDNTTNDAEQIFNVTDEISSEPVREIVDDSTGKYFFDEFMTPSKILRICSPWISKAFVEKFTDLSKKNIKIQIITHYEAKNLPNFESVQFLEKNKSHNLQFIVTEKLVHLKMFIKDETLAVNGSANFTSRGLWNQKNRITIFRELNTVKNEIKIFDDLWNELKQD